MRRRAARRDAARQTSPSPPQAPDHGDAEQRTALAYCAGCAALLITLVCVAARTGDVVVEAIATRSPLTVCLLALALGLGLGLGLGVAARVFLF